MIMWLIIKLAFRITLAAGWFACFWTDKFWPEGQNSLPNLWCGLTCILALTIYAVEYRYLPVSQSLKFTWVDGLVIVWIFYGWTRDIDLNFYTLASPQHYADIVLLAQYLCFRCASRFVKPVWLITPLLVAASLQATYALLQFLELARGDNEVWRVTGTFFGSAPLALYLTVSICYSIAFLLQTSISRLSSYFFWGCIIVCVAALLVTKSRAAYLASLIAVAYILYIFYITPSLTLFRLPVWGRVVCSGLVVILVIFFLYMLKPSSGNGRFLIWKISALMIRDHLVWGSGYHSFPGTFGSYQAAYFAGPSATSQEAQLAGNGQFAFNEWLRITVELGIVGILIWVSLISMSLIDKQDKTLYSHPLRLGAYSAIIAWCVFATFSYPQAVSSLQQQLFFGFAILCQKNTKKNVHQKKHFSNNNVNFFIHSIFTLSLSGWTIWNAYLLYQWHSARIFLLKNQFAKATLCYSLNYRFLQGEADYLLEYSDALLQTGQLSKAIIVLESAAVHAESVEVYLTIGNVYSNLGSYYRAEKWLRKAVFMMPYLMNTRFELYTFYRHWGHMREAESTARYIMKMSSKVPNGRADYYHKQVASYLENRKHEQNK